MGLGVAVLGEGTDADVVKVVGKVVAIYSKYWTRLKCELFLSLFCLRSSLSCVFVLCLSVLTECT